MFVFVVTSVGKPSSGMFPAPQLFSCVVTLSHSRAFTQISLIEGGSRVLSGFCSDDREIREKFTQRLQFSPILSGSSKVHVYKEALRRLTEFKHVLFYCKFTLRRFQQVTKESDKVLSGSSRPSSERVC